MAQTPHGTFDYEPTRRGATPFLALTKPLRRRYRGAPVWAAELPNDYLHSTASQKGTGDTGMWLPFSLFLDPYAV